MLPHGASDALSKEGAAKASLESEKAQLAATVQALQAESEV